MGSFGNVRLLLFQGDNMWVKIIGNNERLLYEDNSLHIIKKRIIAENESTNMRMPDIHHIIIADDDNEYYLTRESVFEFIDSIEGESDFIPFIPIADED